MGVPWLHRRTVAMVKLLTAGSGEDPLPGAFPAGVSFLGVQVGGGGGGWSGVGVDGVEWRGPGAVLYSHDHGSRVEAAGTRVHGCRGDAAGIRGSGEHRGGGIDAVLRSVLVLGCWVAVVTRLLDGGRTAARDCHGSKLCWRKGARRVCCGVLEGSRRLGRMPGSSARLQLQWPPVRPRR